MEISVEVSDWFNIDASSFRDQIFTACKWTLPEDLRVRPVMPVYEAVRSAIESGLADVPPDVAATQRYELDRAEERLSCLISLTGPFLNTLMRYYGGRAAADACIQLLRLGGAEIAGRLASFQEWDHAVRGDVSTWYSIRGSHFTVCQAVFQRGDLTRIWLRRETGKKQWDVWLPREYLPPHLECSTEIDDLTWVSFVIPQCGLKRILGSSDEIPWLINSEILCSPESEMFSSIQSPQLGKAQRNGRTAKLCLNSLSDPPTARVGPYVFPAPGMTGEFFERRQISCLRDVVQVKDREWRAPTIWHAVLWLRDLAGWNQHGRPHQDPLSSTFKDSPAGAFLFRGQRNAQWPLRPSILRETGDKREIVGQALLRFILANFYLQNQTESPLSLADAFIGAAQHYGLPTWYLDFSVDPLSAAYFASDKAISGQEAAIYWISTEAALSHGAKLILAPFWVERLYAQLGCFLDLHSLISSADSKDELASHCYRVIFPASTELAESEYGNESNRIYPESKWVAAAIEWAINSDLATEDEAQLAKDLITSAGQPPYIASSILPRNHQRMFGFISRIVEWTALTLKDSSSGERHFSVDNRAMELLFRSNPGVYKDFNHIMKLVKRLGVKIETSGDIFTDIGAKAALLWLSELEDATHEVESDI